MPVRRVYAFLLLSSAFPALWPQSTVSTSWKKIALVIGNDAYPIAPLRNAVNDSVGMGEILEKCGFEVQGYANLTLDAIERATTQFVGSLRPGDVALIYYAGHGMQLEGQNYLVPTNFS